MSTIPKFKIKTDGITYCKLWAIRRVLQPEEFVWRATSPEGRLPWGWLLFGGDFGAPAYYVDIVDGRDIDFPEVPQDKVLEVFFGTST